MTYCIFLNIARGIINFKRGNDPRNNQGRDIFKPWEIIKETRYFVFFFREESYKRTLQDDCAMGPNHDIFVVIHFLKVSCDSNKMPGHTDISCSLTTRKVSLRQRTMTHDHNLLRQTRPQLPANHSW